MQYNRRYWEQMERDVDHDVGTPATIRYSVDDLGRSRLLDEHGKTVFEAPKSRSVVRNTNVLYGYAEL